MGISETIACLRGLPPARQIALCLLALDEPHRGVQSAAMHALCATNRLNRPDLVADRFQALLPAVQAEAAVYRDDLLRIARDRVHGGTDRQRLAGYRLVAAVHTPASLSLLLEGAEDPAHAIREMCLQHIAHAFEAFVAAMHAPRTERTERLGAGNERFLWQALEAALLAPGAELRTVALQSVVAIGAPAEALLLAGVAAAVAPLDRTAVVLALSRGPARSAAELAVALGAATNPAARTIARQVIAARRDEMFRLELLGRVRDAAPERHDAMWELIGPDALAAVAAMAAPVDALRIAAAVPHHFTPVAKRNLVLALLAHGDDGVRLAAARLVVQCGLAGRDELLVPLLAARSFELRQFAMHELAQSGFGRYLERFDGMDGKARGVAAKALAKIDHAFLDRIAVEIGSLDADRRLKAARIASLAGAGEALRDPLLQLLADPDRRVRATVVRIVELAGSVAGMHALIEALSDPDDRVRANAIEAFEALDDARHAELLVPFLRDRDNRVRANAAKALWNVGWPGAEAAVAEMLSDDDEAMRLSAVWVLGEVAMPNAARLLGERLAAEASAAVCEKIQQVQALLAQGGGV